MMYRSHINDVQLRFGTHGPGYIVRGPRTDFGIVILPPGQDFPNHYHRTIEESFLTLEGHVVVYVNGERYEFGPGDYFRCDPYDMHYFVNESDAPWRALFVKAPYNPEDGVVAEWKPGDPLPQIERLDGTEKQP
jgi:quercetin dioxygenase-like cupin family protein